VGKGTLLVPAAHRPYECDERHRQGNEKLVELLVQDGARAGRNPSRFDLLFAVSPGPTPAIIDPALSRDSRTLPRLKPASTRGKLEFTGPSPPHQASGKIPFWGGNSTPSNPVFCRTQGPSERAYPSHNMRLRRRRG